MLINNKTLSYAAIAEKIGMERSGIYRALAFPWRTKLKTYLKLAEVLDYPLDDAKAEWRESNLTKAKELLFLPDGIHEAPFRDIKPPDVTFTHLAESTGLGKSTVESVCYAPYTCSWKAICKVLDFLELNREDYYNAWKYSVYLQKKKVIDKQI